MGPTVGFWGHLDELALCKVIDTMPCMEEQLYEY